MKNFNKNNLGICGLFFFIWSLSSCGSSVVDANTKSDKGAQNDTINLIQDSKMENGLKLKRAEGVNSPGVLFPFGKKEANPSWEIAEWGSKFELTEQDKTEINDSIIYRNQGKKVYFIKQKGDFPIVGMDLSTSQEYSRPRVYGESWPHVLIEQGFNNKPFVKDLKNLILEFKGRLTKSELKMKQEQFNPDLHTAQFQLFISVQNLNKNSAYYGDYVWFGVPFYDYRYDKISLYASQDVAKNDATGKFIYSIANDNYMNGKSFKSNDWIEIEIDLYPHILKAIQTAKSRGFLTGSLDTDFQVSGINLGWEVPGTLDVGFEVGKFKLNAVKERE